MTLHEGLPVLSAGEPLDRAARVLIMVHGRGASAEDILRLADELAAPDMAYLAPQAADNEWYPRRFMVETALNEPWLGSALGVVDGLVARCTAVGITHERIHLLGFSQGACLAAEYAARHPARYGGVFVLSGALIGGETEARPKVEGSLAGTPVFLGCSNSDPHIPAERVRLSATQLKDLGAAVEMKLYPLMGHTVNAEEVQIVRGMLGLKD